MTSRLLRVVPFLLTTAITLGTWPSHAQDRVKINIGLVAGLSGRDAIAGREVGAVADFAKSRLVQKFGSKYDIDIVRKDDTCSNDIGYRAARELSEVQKVQFVVGHTCSANAVVQLYRDNGIMFISTSANTDMERTGSGQRG
jgi:ABC-type branched-subunit amino acid transport system substrate-binding protein